MTALNLDLHTFFTNVRPIFGNLLTQGQVNGLMSLITGWEATAQTDIRWLAYELATTWWETDKTMLPIAEIGHGAGHSYGVVDQTGKAPYGRGDVQLTFRANYILADAKLGLGGKLAADYDLALNPMIATKILFQGMEEGWFRKAKLADYINGTKCDYVNARNIINSKLDQADTIAAAAVHFEAAIRSATLTPVAPIPSIPPATPLEKSTFWFTAVINAIRAILAKLKLL